MWDYNDSFDGFDDIQFDDFYGYGFSGGYDTFDTEVELDEIFSNS